MKSLCRRRLLRLASLWHFAHFLGRGHPFRPQYSEMCHVVRPETRSAPWQAESAPSKRTDANNRTAVGRDRRSLDSLPECETAAKLRINRLIAARAWTDAALALVELELPQWSLRRIVQKTANGTVACQGSRSSHSNSMRSRRRAMKFLRWLSWSRSWRQDATPLRPRRKLPRLHTLAQRKISPCVATTLPNPRANHVAAKADDRACHDSRQVLFRFLFRLLLLIAFATFAARGFGATFQPCWRCRPFSARSQERYAGSRCLVPR